MPEESNSLDIGYGLRIELTQADTWRVLAKNGCFDLVEASDFWRVIILLERPYTDVKKYIDEYIDRTGSGNYFPYWKVVSAGFSFETDQWASLALSWFPNLALNEKVKLCDQLDCIANSKWAGQKSRQLASRYAKQLK